MTASVKLDPQIVKPSASSSSSAPPPQNQDCLFYFFAEPKFSHETGQLIGMLANKNIKTEMADPTLATHFFLLITKSLLETKEYLLPLMSRLVDAHFKERLFPVVMDKTAVFNPHDAQPFIEFWNNKLQNTPPQSQEFSEIQTISAGIAPLMRAIRDTLSFNLPALFQSNMQQVVEAVEQRAHLLKPRQFFFLPPSSLNQPIGLEPALFQLSALFEGKTQVLISGEALTGKSTLAIEYAKRVTSYRGVFWIDASSKETIEEGFSQIAAQLGTSKEDAKRTLLRMDRFLLIYDNLNGGVSYSIFPNAHTLLIGTNLASPDIETTHFTPEDAVRFITQELGASTSDATLLASLLECHIGNLAEAVEFIKATKISIPSYNDNYLNNKDQLLDKQAKRKTRSKTIVGQLPPTSILDPSPQTIARCQAESVETLAGRLKDLNIQIFVSYSWSDNGTVNRMDPLFGGLGLSLLRDARELRPFNSLREFMRKVIRVADYTFSMVSDKYLLSFNCLFEVTTLMGDPCWRNRIFPLVVPGTDLTDQKIHFYETHWEQESQKFERLNNQQDALIARDGARKLGAYLRFVRDTQTESIDVQLNDRFHKTLALMAARQERLEKKGLYSQAIFHLPMGRNKDFIGRDKELKALEEALKSGQRGSITHTGMGGIGKSQLALEYAYRHEKEYEMIYWVRAEDIASLRADYRQLGLELGIGEEFLTDDKVVATVKGELEKRQRCLIIFDNADDPKTLSNAVPQKGGHVIITSRNPDWPNALRLELFTEQESINYVRQLTAIVGQENELSLLVKELGYLPLALTQAAAYIRRQQIDVATYLASYKQHLSQQEKGYPGSVATAWLMSIEKISKEDPSALILLNICSLLEPDNIPDYLLRAWLKLKSGQTTDLDFQDALYLLESYSLIHQKVVMEGDTHKKFISIHRLIQMVTRDQCSKVEAAVLTNMGVLVLAQQFNGGFHTAEQRRQSHLLIDHCLCVVKHVEEQCIILKGAFAELMKEIGNFMIKTDHYAEAQAAFEKSLALQDGEALSSILNNFATFSKLIISISTELAEVQSGDQQPHAETDKSAETSEKVRDMMRQANTYRKLGHALQSDGKLLDAKKVYEKAIAIITEAGKGEDPKAVNQFYNPYITLLFDLGQFQEAKRIQEMLKDTLYKGEGGHEENVSEAFHQLDLARHLLEGGDLLGAKAAAEKGLNLMLKLYGNENHTSVAMAYSQLGVILSKLSQYKEALSCDEKALKMRIAISDGEVSGDIAIAHSNYASALCNLGKFDESKLHLESALEIGLKCYKTEKNQFFSTTYNNLASVTSELGDYQNAILLHKKSINILKEIVGSEDHLEIASRYDSLAGVYQDLKDYQTALDLHQKALKISQKVLDTDQHPKIALIYHNFSTTLAHLNRHEEALEMQRKAQAMMVTQYGTEVHSHVATSYCNTGCLLNDLQVGEAEEALNKSMEIDLKIYDSENHPDVACRYHNLSAFYFKQGDLQRAKESIEKAVNIMIAIKQDHLPPMAIMHSNQGNILQKLGDYKGGVSSCEKAVSIVADRESIEMLVNAYHNLAIDCNKKGDHNEAICNYQKALDLAVKEFKSEEEYDVAPLLIGISCVYAKLGDQERAKELIKQALQKMQRTGQKDNNQMAQCYMELASINSELNDLVEANQMYQKALELFLEINDPNDRPTIATIYNNMGHHFEGAEDYQQAKNAFEKSLEVNIQLHGPDHPEQANTYMRLASINSELNDLTKANQMYQKALEIYIAMNDPNDRSTIATIYNNMGHQFFSAKDYQGAKDAFMKCLEVKIQLYGEVHPEVASLYRNIGAVCSYLGDFDGSAKMKKKAEACGVSTT